MGRLARPAPPGGVLRIAGSSRCERAAEASAAGHENGYLEHCFRYAIAACFVPVLTSSRREMAVEVACSGESLSSTSPPGCVIAFDGKVIAANRSQTQ